MRQDIINMQIGDVRFFEASQINMMIIFKVVDNFDNGAYEIDGNKDLGIVVRKVK